MTECLGAECESREVTVAPSDLVDTTIARVDRMFGDNTSSVYAQRHLE